MGIFGDIFGGLSSLAGGLISSDASEDNARRNIAMQREFAQNGIQWKVADAKKAGIHPAFALGANTSSFSPVSVGDGGGDAIAKAGQFLGRAADAASDADTRAQSKVLASLAIEKAGLENDLLRSQIARTNAPQVGPAMPSLTTRYGIDGQGNTVMPNLGVSTAGFINDSPMKRTISSPEAAHIEPGSITDIGYAKTETGNYPIPSNDVKERIEDSPLEWVWMLRNLIAPMMGFNRNPPPGVKLPPGSPGWVFHPTQGYRPGRVVPYTGGLFRY